MRTRFWLCVPPVIFCVIDAALTLAGQDQAYWAGDMERVNELNPLGWILLRWHPLAFVGGIIVWIAVFCTALVLLPTRAAVLCGLGLAVAHTFGATTWLVRWDGPYPLPMAAGVALLVTADQVTWTCWQRFRGPSTVSWRRISMTQDLKRQFAYDAWANREIAQLLCKTPAPPARAVELLAHIVAAQHIWWGRLHPNAEASPGWPSLTVEESAAALDELAERWRKYFMVISDAELARPVTYTTSTGQSWTSKVGDILQHLAMHGCYHRGQIASHLRLTGVAAPNTDFIRGVREGFVDV
jgi:uncharacterized damage-inducible protein DinB